MAFQSQFAGMAPMGNIFGPSAPGNRVAGSQFGASGSLTSPGSNVGYSLVSDRNPMQELLLGSGVYGNRMKREDAMKNMKGFLGTIGLGGGGNGSASSSSGGNGDGYKELSDSLLGQIGQQGASQTEKINRSYDASLDSSIASLYDRGFGNSTAVDSARGANDRNRQSSLGELNDQLLSQKIGVGSNIGLAGLNAANQRQNMNMQFQQQLYGNLLGGLFG